MKTKTPKQKRSEPIELDCQILVTEITKNAFGWIARATCTTEVPSEPAIQTSNPFVAKLTKEDFDRLQPGDQSRFLAVFTRPRKTSAEKLNLNPACPHGKQICYDCQPELRRTFHKDVESAIAEVAG